MRRRRQVVCGMPERGPEVTKGSIPTYSPPAAIEACMMAAATSFSDAPARSAAIREGTDRVFRSRT